LGNQRRRRKMMFLTAYDAKNKRLKQMVVVRGVGQNSCEFPQILGQLLGRYQVLSMKDLMICKICWSQMSTCVMTRDVN
jgi:hypothetical protein